jgi:DNA-binding protein YbaB
MDKNNALLNECTRDYFLKTKEKIIHSHNIAANRIHTYSDEEKYIILTIDSSLNFRSVNISKKLFTNCDKKGIIDRMIKIINRAIIKSSIMGADEIKKAVSSKEYEEIISKENQNIKEGIEIIQENYIQSIKQLSIINKTIVSDSKIITLVISGNKLIKSISINDDYFSPQKIPLLETELMQTINKAIQEIQKEIQIIFNMNEEEVNKMLLRGK